LFDRQQPTTQTANQQLQKEQQKQKQQECFFPEKNEKLFKKMDEREFEFVTELLDEYNCGICHGVMINPVCCREGHSWCESCIGQWLHNHNTCPMGRDRLTVAQLNKLRPVEQVILHRTYFNIESTSIQ
jgi:hypothetical protein